MQTSQIQETLPAWDNSKEYKDLLDPAFAADYQKIQEGLNQLKTLGSLLQEALPNLENTEQDFSNLVRTAQNFSIQATATGVLHRNLYVFADSLLALNGTDTAAESWVSRLQECGSEIRQASNPFQLFLQRMPKACVDLYLSHPEISPEAYSLEHMRQMRPHLLSLEGENLLTALSVDGHKAWSNLYDKLSSTLECQIETPSGIQKTGFATALANLEESSELLRQNSYLSIQKTFSDQKDTFASILNALIGWNLKVAKTRSHTKPLHYLEPSLHGNRLSKKTLDALMGAIRTHKSLGQRAVMAFAKAQGKSRLEPWNLKAPAPSETPENLSYREGLKLVRESVDALHPSVGDFVAMMDQSGFIDAQTGDKRRPSAYCTGFAKSRTPRVFTKWSHSSMSARVLAHELGHAFHSYAMRDLPRVQLGYPMTLAETASIFGEILFAEHLKKTYPESLFSTLWMEGEMAVVYMTNIPMRYDLETALYEERSRKALNAARITELMQMVWNDWYGDTTTEPDLMFWAYKLHFYHYAFYNFPYSFGYLFSHSIYASYEQNPEGFFERYVNLLKDTGRSSIEDLVSRHLQANTEEGAFWEGGIRMIERKIRDLENLIESRA